MSPIKSLLASCALASSSMAVQATSVPLAGDGQWRAFTVDAFVSNTGGAEWIDADDTLTTGYGSALSFDFSISEGQVGTLTVVDAGLFGDVFRVFDQAVLLGETGSVPSTLYDDTAPVLLDFDAALLDTRFSRGTFTLAAGTYSIRGELLQSVMLDGAPLNATVGGIRLAVSPVPEPAGSTLAFAALGMACFILRRHVSR